MLGFVAMLASAFFAVTSYRAVTTATQLGVVEGAGGPQAAHRPAGRSGHGQPGFMERFEERWNRRRDEGR